MATLNIYDKFGELLEAHTLEGSLLDYLKSIPTYKETIRPPYYAKINGENWPYSDHGRELSGDDIIDVTLEPNDPATIIYIVIAVASAAYAYYVSSNLPQNYEKSRQQGKSIYNSNARANVISPSGIIREAAGTYPIFPDLICPIRRKYINNEEFVYLFMCVSSGYMAINETNVYVGESSLFSYEGDYDLAIFEPGATVTSSDAHENWHTSEQVSDLQLVTSTNELLGNWTAAFAGASITVFEDGDLVEFPFPLDSIFEITGGTNPGAYRVASIGSPNHTAQVVKQDRESNTDIRVSSSGRFGNLRPVNWGDTASSPSGFTSVSPAESVTLKGLNGDVNWEGPFVIIPENETVQYVEVDIFFPRGLTKLDSDGDEQSQSVEFEIQYRAVGDEDWVDAVNTATSPNTLIFTGDSLDELGFTIEIDLGSAIRPEVRIRRVTKDAVSVSESSDSIVVRIKSKLETPTSYSGVTTMGLVLRGTNAIAQTAENKINIKGASRKLPTLAELQAAAAGTPFDISESATLTDGDFALNDNAASLRSDSLTDPSQQEKYPTPNYSGASVHVLDDRFLFYSDDGALRSYSYPAKVQYFAGRPPRFRGFQYDGYSDLGASDKPRNAIWLTSGTRVALLDVDKDPSSEFSVRMLDLSTAYDLSTATLATDGEHGTDFEVISAECFYINNGGTRLWIGNGYNVSYANSNHILQYDISTAYDISTMTPDVLGSPASQIGLDVSTQLSSISPSNNLKSFWMDDYTGAQPAKLWVMDTGGNIFYYIMSTPGDVSTAVYQSTISLVNNYTAPLYFQVEADHFHITNRTALGYVQAKQFRLDRAITDTRASKSVARFVCNALYDAIGSDVADVVDWTTMASLDTLLESRSDQLNGEFVDETTLWEAIRIMLAAGFTEPSMKEGRLTPVRVAAGTDYNRLYTPDFMTGEGLTIDDEHYDGIDADGIDVEYLDEDSGENEVVKVRLTGDAGVRPKRIQSIGITNRTRAWRYGMRERRRLFYKPATYSFSTEMDALNSSYGDAVGIASDIFGSQSGTVTAVSGSSVTLDFSPVMLSTSPVTTYYAAFKKPDGEFSGLYTITLGSPNNIITLSSPSTLDFTPVTDASPDSDGENTLITIGASDEWGVRAIIREISPQDDTVRVIAEEYVADVYADDDNSPP